MPKRTMRGLSLPGPALPSENRSVQGDYLHSCSQGFGLGPKSPLSQSLHANHSGGEGKNIFVIGTPGLSQSLHANHSGGELPPGRMDWSCADFWLAVGTGKNRSSTTTSPCTPYPLPSELQGDIAEKICQIDYENPYDKIGSEGNGLSTGQKQRVLIARASYRDARCIFL